MPTLEKMKKSCFFSILSSSHIKGFEVFCKALKQSNYWLEYARIDFLIIPLDLSEEEKKKCDSFYKHIKWLPKTKHNINLSQAAIGESAFYKLSAFTIYNYDLVISIDLGRCLFQIMCLNINNCTYGQEDSRML